MAIRGNVLSGARGKIAIDGKTVGFATSVNWREQIDYRPVRVLDELEVVSHEPVGYTVSVTLGTLTLVAENMKTKGWMPTGGAARGERLRNILDLPDLTMTVIDGKTLLPIAVIIGLRIASQNITMDAGNISGTNVECVAREVADATEL